MHQFCTRYIDKKTSIQWTPGTQIYLSSKEIIFGQKRFLNKKKSKKFLEKNFFQKHLDKKKLGKKFV